MHSCLTEFNEEAYRKGIREEGYNDGFNDGFNEAIVTIIQKSQNNNTPQRTVITQLMEYFSLSESDAISLVNEYWH